MNRGIKWWLLGILLGVLLGCCGCSLSLGKEMSQQDKNGEISIYVRGEFCVTAEDGYTPPSNITPMAGMGVRFAGVPLPFEAKIYASEPMSGGLRNFEVSYTSPPALCGVVVSGQVVRDHTGDGFCMAYTLSYPMPSAPLVLDVTYSQIEGLLLPLREATE